MRCGFVTAIPVKQSAVATSGCFQSTSTIELLFAGMILFWLALSLVEAVTDSVLDLLIRGQRAH